MEGQPEIKSNTLLFSDKMLQIVQDLSKYGKIIGGVIIGQLIMVLCLAIGYLLLADGMELALIFMGFYLISTGKLVMIGLLCLFLIGINIFVGMSMYRFGNYMSKGIQTENNKMMEDGMKWLKNAVMSTFLGIVIFILFVIVSI
ncbi:MAG: hypothetical protein LBI72_13045 [Flavobacteriaceae bacterium]|jgi:hypothetical protein|nr:hypothetical protein [Flavobacteriaceae bacterium]